MCSDLTLCNSCEEKHDHPTLKCKSNEISTKRDVLNLLQNFEYELPKKSEGIIELFIFFEIYSKPSKYLFLNSLN